MRISGGLARGIVLQVPKSGAVRPATDGLRQAVFSSLAGAVAGARFLDLFAGTGAYGLEALSRGAAGGVFVERNARAFACLRQNLAAVAKACDRRESDCTALPMDALSVPTAGADAPDLVFIDPPYEIVAEVAPTLFERLTTVLAPKPDALVVFELPGERELQAPGWILRKRLGHGARQPTAAIFQHAPG